MSQKAINGTVPSDIESAAAEKGNSIETPQAKQLQNNVVDFQEPNDPLNPLHWSRTYKWTVVWLLSMMNLIVTLSTVLVIPAAPQILSEFSSTNAYYSILLVTIWELGEAVGPLLSAPLSEIYGRVLVSNIANTLFVLASVGGGLSINLSMLVVFRFLNGVAVISMALEPAIVGDMFIQEERGTALSIMGLPPLLGPALGPVIGGFLTQSKGWRWAFWLSAITSGVCAILFLLICREPYKVVILRRKAARMRKETGNRALRSVYDNEDLSAKRLLKLALVRPLQMLLQSKILLLLALYGSVIYGFLYLVSTTLTEVFESAYDFSEGASGLTFLGIGIGMILGVFTCGLTLDPYLKKMSAEHGGEMKPEYRLRPMVLGGLLIPAGFFLYGWSLEYRLHWIVPIIGTSLIGFGLLVTTLPLSAYLVDTYTVHAASGMAVVLVLRSIAGTVLPLVGAPLYANLGPGWGNSILGFIALLFVPVPLLFIKYGEQIRKNSSYKVIT
ncbi:hypothetical protein MMC15_005532 [Xylographa vitiligo]|nr:hypothetical protein [Xylographa vitiligo]